MADIRVSGMLDDFNRAAEDPLSHGGDWAGINSNLKIISTPRRVQHSTGSGVLSVQQSYWAAQSYSVSAASEVEVWGWTGIGANFGEGWLLGLYTNTSAGSLTGYSSRWSEEIGDNAIQVRKWTSGSNSVLLDERSFGNLQPNFGGDMGQSIMLFRTNGAALETWASFDSGATFTLYATVNDSTYRSGLYLALGLNGPTEWNGFGGGVEEPWVPQFIRRPWRYKGRAIKPNRP